MNKLSLKTSKTVSRTVALAGAPAQAVRPKRIPVRGLMVCALFGLAYRALRCFAAAGVTVHVLGNHKSRGMLYTRHCASFTETERAFDGTCDDAMIALVNAHVVSLGIDFVFAGDQPATRSLAAMRDRLCVPCYPMPDLVTFDLLNDKAQFTELCRTLDILCPPTWVLQDRRDMLASLAEGSIKLPIVVKPLSLDGNRGVSVLNSPADVHAAEIAYEPVLIQQFIPGVDIGASVYAEQGRIKAYICHWLRRATYLVLDEPIVLTALTRIVEATGANGILNFDMRLAPDGKIFFLECNPRVFYKMNLSMLAGINFPAHGLQAIMGDETGPTAPVSAMPTTAVRTPKALLAALATPWRITRRDLAMLGYVLSDPLPYVREQLGFDFEDRSY